MIWIWIVHRMSLTRLRHLGVALLAGAVVLVTAAMVPAQARAIRLAGGV